MDSVSNFQHTYAIEDDLIVEDLVRDAVQTIVLLAEYPVGGSLVQMGLLSLPPKVTDITDSIPFGTQIMVSTIGAIIVVLIARIVAR